MEEKGLSRHRVRQALKKARKDDWTFSGGEILGSMCTAPHEAAAEAHALFLETNLGDPGHFPGTAQLEKEALTDLLQLFHAPTGAAGRFVAGGTEANILACAIAREKTGKTKIVLSESAHFSFDKAARFLGMELVEVPCAASGHADPKALAKAVTKDTALVVAVAGTTELGLVDPVEELALWCGRNDVLLHVDAAYGGYILPFMADASRKPVKFDFANPGVWSLCCDPHKGGMATIPAGVLLMRDGADWERMAVPSPYVSTETQSTIMGTRPGGPVAATWAVHRFLGREGLASVAETCLDNAAYLAAQLPEMGVELVASPELAVVTFRAGSGPEAARRLIARLSERGFRLNHVPRYKALRVVCNPHVTRERIDRFLKA
ncbi:MAG: tyrosine decarboxylase MfnA, partial [Halobacteriales archaeon]|nr:tyrosine decarboxylase MfnA [Halobacteriales archaeon]